MSIELVRIDDRLIHGQVATTWLKDYDIEQVIIADDEVSQNEMKKTMVTVAAPTGIRVHVFPVDKFIQVQKENPIKRRTLLLFTQPIDVQKALDQGVDISEVYVGGMRSTSERRRISKAVNISPEEEAIFQSLAERGVSLIIQTVPRDEKNELIDLL
ncbi:PTS system mannose/fructose/N-acetylgalactosamine-transporter subunit IIB [Enterococcus sp. LJL99]